MDNREKDLFRLGHILECTEKIIHLTTVLHSIENFEEKWIERDAMLRSFEIIGEASHHVSKETKTKYPDTDWASMRGMRNFISHEYFGLQLDTVWATATQDIPLLKSQIEQIIADFEK